jgi:glycosyltransferase involved in cell wall biosynthesis
MLRTVLEIRKRSARARVTYLNGLVFEGIVATKLLARRPAVVKVVGDLIWERARNAGATELTLDEFQIQALPLRWSLLRRLQAWYTAKADAVIVPSRYLARVVEQWGVPPSKIHVIYNSLPPIEGEGEPVPPADIVTVARLVPWKGIHVLIDLAAKNGWSMNIVGDGPLAHTLAQQIARSGSNNIRLLGALSRAGVNSAMKSARIFVLNSSYEGLPHVVLEAKAAGTPVVATRVGGTTETLEDGSDGFLVPFGDTEMLQRRITQLLNDERLRSSFAEAGRKRVLHEMTFERMVDSTVRLLLAVPER